MDGILPEHRERRAVCRGGILPPVFDRRKFSIPPVYPSAVTLPSSMVILPLATVNTGHP
jgi:hypothetical protein